MKARSILPPPPPSIELAGLGGTWVVYQKLLSTDNPLPDLGLVHRLCQAGRRRCACLQLHLADRDCGPVKESNVRTHRPTSHTGLMAQEHLVGRKIIAS